MNTLPSLWITYTFILIISCYHINGAKDDANNYNLKGLEKIEDWFSATSSNPARINMFQYIMTLEAKAKREQPTGSTEEHPNQSRKVISRFSEDPNRNHPQTVTTFWSAHYPYIFVYIPAASNAWDYKHQHDWQPKTVTLTHREHAFNISVHSGIYHAINDEAFYKPLLQDILAKKQHYERSSSTMLALSGHGFGGSIVSLLAVLWKGNADCPFVRYFRSKTRMMTEARYKQSLKSGTLKTGQKPNWFHKRAVDALVELPDEYVKRNKLNKRIRDLLNRMEVITFGAFGVLSHHDMTRLQNWDFGIRVFHNVIRATDPLPMMYNGVQSDAPPQGEFETIDVEHAYYAPIVDYIVIMNTGDANMPYRLKPLRCLLFETKAEENIAGALWMGHLVEGAESLKKELDKQGKDVKDELTKMIERESSYSMYKKEIDSAVNMYAYSARFDEPLGKQDNQSVMMFIVEMLAVVFVICCVCGGLFGYFVTKHFTLQGKEEDL
eukprot:84961_1